MQRKANPQPRIDCVVNYTCQRFALLFQRSLEALKAVELIATILLIFEVQELALVHLKGRERWRKRCANGSSCFSRCRRITTKFLEFGQTYFGYWNCVELT